jgi:hypothetical protein
MKCNETQGKWCKNKHGASKIIDLFETYQATKLRLQKNKPSTKQQARGLASMAKEARQSQKKS